MKIIKKEDTLETKSLPTPLTYKQTLSLIQVVFSKSSRVGFDDTCVSSVICKVKNGKISEMVIEYDKICIEQSGHKNYWPIIPYEEKEIFDLNYFNKFR